MIVLGIDPGLASTGYALLEYGKNKIKCLEYGVIETTPDTVLYERLHHIFESIQQIVNKYHPDSLAMEDLFFARNVTSALLVAEAKGVISVAAFTAGLTAVFEYKPNQIKQAVTGFTSADKKSVQEACKMLLGLKSVPKPDHAADAIAAGITHINTAAVRV